MSKVRNALYFLLFVSVFNFAACYGGHDASTTQKLQASVEDNWNAYKEQYGVPSGGLALYIESPRGNYFVSTGLAATVDKDTHFRIASNTKTFTAAAVMLLHQQGKLNIDDAIVSNIPGTAEPYLPNTAPWAIPLKSDIKIRELLNHTAGVWDITNDPVISNECLRAEYRGKIYPDYIMYEKGDPNHQFTLDELIEVVTDCQIKSFVPGTNYHYSNTGYTILAKIIERVSGQTYDTFVSKNLLVTNGLSSTTIPMLATDRTIPAPYCDGFVFEGGVFKPWNEDNMSPTVAEGNMISTPANLTQWIRKLIKGEAGINAANVELMKTPSAYSTSYGLGILNGGGLGYGHNGAHNGFTSLMLYNPADDVSVVIYSNVMDNTNFPKEQALLKKVAQDAKSILGY
jgi:D-alanyl-D-alanine carboxypeptidase